MNLSRLGLDGDLTGGAWVTIDGAHVYIKDGVVAAGGGPLKGKKLSEVHDAAASRHEVASRQSKTESETAFKAGDSDGHRAALAKSDEHIKKVGEHRNAAAGYRQQEFSAQSDRAENAKSLSVAAARASQNAADNPTEANHQSAAQAHSDAASAHLKAGDKQSWEDHADLAFEHLSKGEEGWRDAKTGKGKGWNADDHEAAAVGHDENAKVAKAGGDEPKAKTSTRFAGKHREIAADIKSGNGELASVGGKPGFTHANQPGNEKIPPPNDTERAKVIALNEPRNALRAAAHGAKIEATLGNGKTERISGSSMGRTTPDGLHVLTGDQETEMPISAIHKITVDGKTTWERRGVNPSEQAKSDARAEENPRPGSAKHHLARARATVAHKKLPLSLAGDLEGGRWVTIEGEHIYIKGGVVAAGGGPGLKGKKLSEAHDIHADAHEESAKHANAAAEDARKSGDTNGHAKALANSDEHLKAAGELRNKADEHRTAEKATENSGKSESPKIDAAGVSKELGDLHSSQPDRGSGAGREPVKVSDLREKIRSKYGDASASHEHLDPMIKSMRGKQVRLISGAGEHAAGGKSLTPAEHAGSIKGASTAEGGETFSHIEPHDAANTKTVASGVHPVASELKHVYENAAHPDMTEDRIHGALGKLDGLKKEEVEAVAQHMGIPAAKGESTAGLKKEIKLWVTDRRGKALRAYAGSAKEGESYPDFVRRTNAGRTYAALSADAIILDASALDPSREIPGGLEGLPTSEAIDDETNIVGSNADGTPKFGTKFLPVRYYLKEAYRTPAKDKSWALRGATQLSSELKTFDITDADIDDTVRNYADRAAAGIVPFIPDTHVDYRDAAANNGSVIGVQKRRNADGTASLMAKLKIVGTRGQEKILNNDVSVYLVNGDDNLVVDATGKRYKGRVLHHVALTPNPNQPHLEPFQRIAASADATDSRDVPVYLYVDSRLALTGAPMCTPEETAAAKDHLASMGEDTSDVKPENAMDKMIQHGKKMKMKHEMLGKAMMLSADADPEAAIKSILSDRDKLKADLDAAEKAKAVALSGDPASLTPWNLSAFEMNAATLREACVASGKISEADAKAFDSIWRDKANKPTRIGLSATCDNGHPAELNFWRVVRGLSGTIRTASGTVRPGDTSVADPAIALDGATRREDVEANKPMTSERRAQILGSIGLEPAKK